MRHNDATDAHSEDAALREMFVDLTSVGRRLKELIARVESDPYHDPWHDRSKRWERDETERPSGPAAERPIGRAAERPSGRDEQKNRRASI